MASTALSTTPLTVVVMVLAAAAGFAAVWFLMGLVSAGTPTKAAPAQRPSASDWAAVLEVPPDATRDEIRQAYRDKMQEYQPERLAVLAPDLRRLAEQRVRELNAAFEAAERSHAGG